MKKYIEEHIDNLRAQRAHNSSEGYSFSVVESYNYIKVATGIKGFNADFKKSDYIMVIGTGSKKQIRETKELAF